MHDTASIGGSASEGVCVFGDDGDDGMSSAGERKRMWPWTEKTKQNKQHKSLNAAQTQQQSRTVD